VTTGSRSLRPCPEKKGGILSRFVAAVNAEANISFVETETCGVSTRYRHPAARAPQALADAFADALRPKMKNGTSAPSCRPISHSLARRDSVPRDDSDQQDRRRVRRAPAEPPPAGGAFSSRKSAPWAEFVSRCRSRAARTQRFSSPSGPRSAACRPSAERCQRGRSGRSAETRSAARDSRPLAGRARAGKDSAFPAPGTSHFHREMMSRSSIPG